MKNFLITHSTLGNDGFSKESRRVHLTASTTVHINNSDWCVYSSLLTGSPSPPSHSSLRCCKWHAVYCCTVQTHSTNEFHCINCKLPGRGKEACWIANGGGLYWLKQMRQFAEKRTRIRCVFPAKCACNSKPALRRRVSPQGSEAWIIAFNLNSNCG